MSRFLGVDLGTRRIGVASSDPTGTVASPLRTLPYRGRRDAVGRVAALCREHEIAAVVLGWPRSMAGTSGPAAARAVAFAEALRRAVSVPVELWDERLTTVEAERALIRGAVRRERRRTVRDQIAAALILQGYLDARARRLAPARPGHNRA